MPPNLPPDDICGYRVAQTLAPRTFLAIDPRGRKVILKKLDDDCLLQGQLHPSIKERLERVRQLPHLATANLLGVERDASGAFIIWEYLDGEDFATATASPACAPEKLIHLLRELSLSIEALHAHGIIHGAIKSGNVIVDAGGRVRITHVSPLLYNDPLDDEQAVLRVAESVLSLRTDRIDSLAQAVRLAGQSRQPLRTFAGQLAGITRTSKDPGAAVDRDDEGRLIRQHSIVSSMLILLLGLAAALVVWWWLTGGGL